MKKLMIAAAALTVAVATAPAFVTPSQAASSNKEFCDLAKAQRNAPAWNEYYGCLKGPARQAYAAAPVRTRAVAVSADRGPGSSYCQLAKSQRNAPSWNEYYGCIKH